MWRRECFTDDARKAAGYRGHTVWIGSIYIQLLDAVYLAEHFKTQKPCCKKKKKITNETNEKLECHLIFQDDTGPRSHRPAGMDLRQTS